MGLEQALAKLATAITGSAPPSMELEKIILYLAENWPEYSTGGGGGG